MRGVFIGVKYRIIKLWYDLIIILNFKGVFKDWVLFY